MQAGQQITPTLRLRSLLGKGGMGSVWIADHLTLNTQVAVKFMSSSFVENESLVQRFRTEAMAAAQIKSPHIAQVFDHGFMTDGTPYIVMELLEGEDLKRKIRRDGPMPLKDVAHVISQAAKALGRAHAMNIVHRDIKPDNIFLCNIDGETFVKVLDFGVAKLGAGAEGLGATTTGSMMGTPLYMSPEQLLSAKRVDHRSDLWSLAVVAYHSITGRVPFQGETVGSLSVAVHTGVFEPPSRVRPDVPPTVDAWFFKMLRRDPNERYGSAKEMADALDQAINAGGPHSAMFQRPAMGSMAPTGEVGFGPASGPMGVTPMPNSNPSAFTPPQGYIQVQSGVNPTLGGTSSEAARHGSSKTPLVAAGAVFVVGIVAAILIVALRGSHDDAAEAPSPPTPAANAANAQTSPTPIVAPEQPAQSAAPASTPAVKPAEGAPTQATQAQTTTKKTAPLPSTPATTTAKPTPTKPTGKTGKDTIGF